MHSGTVEPALSPRTASMAVEEATACATITSFDMREQYLRQAEVFAVVRKRVQEEIKYVQFRKHFQDNDPRGHSTACVQCCCCTQRGYSRIVHLIFFFLLLIVFSIVVLYSRDGTYSYEFNAQMKGLILDTEWPPEMCSNMKKNFFDVGNHDDFWDWLRGVFVPELFGDEGKVLNDAVIVGKVRMVQARVRKNTHCNARYGIKECVRPLRDEDADKSPYGPKGVWTWHKDSDLKTFRYQGSFSGYVYSGFIPGSGYHHDFLAKHALGANASAAGEGRNATKSLISELEFLQNNKWLDEQTRAVTIFMTVYSANVDLFHVSRLTFEFVPSGGIVPSYVFRVLLLDMFGKGVTFFDYALIFLHIALFGVTCFYFLIWGPRNIFSDARSAWKGQTGFAYFKDPWNIVDGLCFGALFIGMSLKAHRFSVSSKTLTGAYASDYVDFQTVSYWAQNENAFLGMGAALLWVKLLKVVDFVPAANVLFRTLKTAAYDTLLFSVIVIAVVAGYAQSAVLLFGNGVFNYRHFPAAFFTLTKGLTGDIDYQELADEDWRTAGVFFISFVFFIMMILLNLFITIIMDAYNIVKEAQEGEARHLNIGYFIVRLAAESAPDQTRQGYRKQSPRTLSWCSGDDCKHKRRRGELMYYCDDCEGNVYCAKCMESRHKGLPVVHTPVEVNRVVEQLNKKEDTRNMTMGKWIGLTLGFTSSSYRAAERMGRAWETNLPSDENGKLLRRDLRRVFEEFDEHHVADVFFGYAEHGGDARAVSRALMALLAPLRPDIDVLLLSKAALLQALAEAAKIHTDHTCYWSGSVDHVPQCPSGCRAAEKSHGLDLEQQWQHVSKLCLQNTVKRLFVQWNACGRHERYLDWMEVDQQLLMDAVNIETNSLSELSEEKQKQRALAHVVFNMQRVKDKSSFADAIGVEVEAFESAVDRASASTAQSSNLAPLLGHIRDAMQTPVNTTTAPEVYTSAIVEKSGYDSPSDSASEQENSPFRVPPLPPVSIDGVA